MFILFSVYLFIFIIVSIIVIGIVVQAPHHNMEYEIELVQTTATEKGKKDIFSRVGVQFSLLSYSWTIKFVDITKLNVSLLFFFSHSKNEKADVAIWIKLAGDNQFVDLLL